jgi:cobalt-zinc-cadmium efflux system membrane fusion protein
MSESPNHSAVLDKLPDAPGRQTCPKAERQSLLGWLGRAVPPLLVFTVLGGLLVWGHHTGWTLPKFSSLAGQNADAKDDWCSEHGVPESQCVECRPDLMPRPKGISWCKLHGVHECPLCQPELAQTRTIPQITAADLARAKRALDLAERPENNSKCKLHLRRIQYVSQEAVEKAGIDVEPVWTAPVVEAVTGSGEVAYDQTRTARLSPRVPGTVFRVYKQAGDRLEKGEVLALVDAAEVGKAKSEFLTALVQVRLKTETFQRLEEGYTHGAIPERSYRDMAAALSEAKIRLTTAKEAMTNLGLPVDVESLKDVPQEKLADRLRFLGLPESVTASLDPKSTTGNLLAVTAAFDGVVVARQVVSGEVVDSGEVLFVAVDVRQMWLTLDLRVEDAKLVALGQEVRFRPDGGKEARGKIAWISTEADPKTRTVKVRVSLGNSECLLRANTFGTGKVVLREERQAVVVPNGAVHWEGCCHVVFVRDKDFLKDGAPKGFHVRTVRPGVKDEKYTEIIAGVLPGEVVATKGSGVLRSELLRNNLGAG